MTLELRVATYAPNGARRGVLPAPGAVSASLPLGDTGVLSVEVPLGAPRLDLLSGPTEAAVEVSYDDGATWTEPDDCRFLLLRRSGDPLRRPPTMTREGPAYVWRLTKAKVLPNGLLNAEGKRPFLSATAGTIIKTLAQEAQARGALAGMDFTTFTTTLDSTGAAWDKIITIYYEPGVSLWTVLLNLSTQGVCDWAMRGRSLRLYRPETVQGGASTAILQRGRDLTEAPYRGTLENLADYAYLALDDGLSLERTNATATAPWGRWETYLSQGGVSDTGTATTLSDAELERGSEERVENTYGLVFSDQSPLPFRDYNIGQTVRVREGNAAPDALRVRQITVTRTDAGIVSGNVVLNDRFLEAEARLARRVTGITGGATAEGGSGARPRPVTDGPDVLAPAPPTGLTVTSVAYLDTDAYARAQVTLSWTAPTTNSNGSAMDDLDHYQVWQRQNVTGGTWRLAFLVDAPAGVATSSPYPVGSSWQFYVRAVDTSGNRSAPSNVQTQTMASDTTAPAAPSTPVMASRLGVLRITWNGLTGTGTAQPADFSHAVVHLSSTGGFTPSASTVVDRLDGAGTAVVADKAYGTTWYAKVVTYDRSGNASTPSAQATATVTALVQTDVIGKVLDGASLIDLSVDGTAALAAGTVDTTRLRVGQANLIVDAPFMDPDLKATRLATSTSGWSFVNDAAQERVPGGTMAMLVTTSGSNKNLHLNTTGTLAQRASIPVTPGTRVRFSAWCKALAGWTGTLRVFLDTRNAAGVIAARQTSMLSTATDLAPFRAPGTGWTRFTWEFIVPDDVVGIDVGVYCSSTSSGTAYVTEPDLRLVVPGVLIENGAITAAKIAALAVEADAIAANAITADKIAAGAITAVKIAADAVEAAKIKAGAVTAAKLEAVLALATRLIAGDPDGARVELGLLATGVNGMRVRNSVGDVLVDLTNGQAIFRGTVDGAAFSSAPVGTGRIVMGPAVRGPNGDAPAIAWDPEGDGVSWTDPHLRVGPDGSLVIQGRQAVVGLSQIVMGNAGLGSDVARYGIEMSAINPLDGSLNAKLEVRVAEADGASNPAMGYVYANRLRVGSSEDTAYNALSKRHVTPVSVPRLAWTTMAFQNISVKAEDDGLMDTSASTVLIPRTGWYNVLLVASLPITTGVLLGRIIDQASNVLFTGAAPSPLQTVTVSGPLYVAKGVELRFQVYHTDTVARTTVADGGAAPFRFAVVISH